MMAAQIELKREVDKSLDRWMKETCQFCGRELGEDLGCIGEPPGGLLCIDCATPENMRTLLARDAAERGAEQGLVDAIARGDVEFVGGGRMRRLGRWLLRLATFQ